MTSETHPRMGDTKIEWTDKTWNPRIEASEEYWRQPMGWDRKAAKEGVRRKVFCASTADIGEARPELDAWRDRALALVALTPNLDWLWLTKRPEYLAEYFAAPDLYRRVLDAAGFFRRKCSGLDRIGITDPTRELPRNLWVGTSVEDQAAADARIPHLLRIPTRVRFLSMEPLLGDVGDMGAYLTPAKLGRCPCILCQATGFRNRVAGELGSGQPGDPRCPDCCDGYVGGIGWVIVGGESGRNARPMHPDWARSIRDQCVSAGVPYFFKQWGGHRYTGQLECPECGEPGEPCEVTPKKD